MNEDNDNAFFADTHADTATVEVTAQKLKEVIDDVKRKLEVLTVIEGSYDALSLFARFTTTECFHSIINVMGTVGYTKADLTNFLKAKEEQLAELKISKLN